ncbi:MAG: NAD-binding protein [Candidatus Marsarchaeota archaeon]|nr:NAD-binding protein [Candidatus Marsarchaeota archaeon]MCL5106037.1 NAD-binding protein [Candidatus Marsarchaeota archaeon]
MKAKFSELKDHVIICGFGIVGEKIADILNEYKIPFIVIEIDEKKIEQLKKYDYNFIEGSATKSKNLKDANIKSAKAIAVVMDDEAKNLFTVITAKDLNNGLFIATRTNDVLIKDRIIEAGANYVVMPQKIASKEIIDEIVKGEAK